MIIGIVSKEDHCQAHVKGLTMDGFEVRVLGGDVTSIPASVKILVVRTKSCSHTSSAAATQWGRLPGNFLIVENGLSGIRRKLSELSHLLEEVVRDQELRRQRTEDRTLLGPPAITTGIALSGMPNSQLPTAKRLEEAPPPTSSTPKPQEAPVATYSFLLPPGWPHALPWTNTIPKERLSREVSAASQIYQGLRTELANRVASNLSDLQTPELSATAADFFKSVLVQMRAFQGLRGKPLQWLALVLFCTKPESTSCARSLMEAYYLFNDGRATNLQAVQAVAWATSRDVIVSTPMKRVEAAPLASAKTTPEEQQMAVSLLREENVALKATNANLAQRVADLENSATGMKSEFDTLIAGLREFNKKTLARVEALEAVDTSIRIENVEVQAQSLTERIEELETRPLPTAPVAPVAGKTSDSLLEALDAIRSRGGDITISLGKSKS